MTDTSEFEAYIEFLQSKSAMKIGARNSAADQATIQKLHDLTGKLGAKCNTHEMLKDDNAPQDADKSIDLEGEETEDNDIVVIEEIDDGMKRNFDRGVGGGTDRDKMPSGDFAGPKNKQGKRTFPIKTPKDVHDAAGLAGHAANPDKVRKRITAIAHRKGPSFVAQLPKSWTSGKALNFSYVKSVGLLLPDDELSEQLAVKSVGVDTIRHPVFIWGHPEKIDVEHEYFDRQTNFWDDQLKNYTRPLTWDHMQDDTMKSSPVIGKTVEFEDDEVGRWAISQLDRAHRYRKAVDMLIEKGALGSSSDTALQYVIRQPTKSGATYIKQWPWFASALTTTPAEPRTIQGVDYFKSLGVDFQFPEATDNEQARALETTLRAMKQSLELSME